VSRLWRIKDGDQSNVNFVRLKNTESQTDFDIMAVHQDEMDPTFMRERDVIMWASEEAHFVAKDFCNEKVGELGHPRAQISENFSTPSKLNRGG